MEKHSLCPECTACPEVVIDDNQVRIGEDANVAILKREEWNVLVDLIQSGRLSKIWPRGAGHPVDRLARPLYSCTIRC